MTMVMMMRRRYSDEPKQSDDVCICMVLCLRSFDPKCDKLFTLYSKHTESVGMFGIFGCHLIL